MPAQNRVRRHDCGDPPQESSAQPMPLHREPAALVVRQPEALALQLLSEDVVLLYEVLNDALLLTVKSIWRKTRAAAVSVRRPRSSTDLTVRLPRAAGPDIRTLRAYTTFSERTE